MTDMGPKAYGLLQSLLAPTKPADKKFEELVKVTKGHLNPKPLVKAERGARKENQLLSI